MKTTKYALEYIVGRRPCGVDESDLPWQRIPGHVYTHPGEAWAAADEFDAGFDHRYTHRVVGVEVDVEPPKPRKAKPSTKTAKEPVKAPTERRQLTENRGQEGFRKAKEMLEDGLRLDFARVHLDPLVTLCDLYLAQSGASVLTRRWRDELDALKARVAAVGNLRLVK